MLNWRVTDYRRAIDVERGRWRDRFTQTAAFVTGWPDPSAVVTAYDNDVAFDVDEGQASRLDAMTARERRAELYHHPIGILRAALTAGARLERADRRVSGTRRRRRRSHHPQRRAVHAVHRSHDAIRTITSITRAASPRRSPKA